MLKLNSFNSIVTTKKLKKAISNAEEDIKNKKEGTWEELISEFEQEYGIQLQR